MRRRGSAGREKKGRKDGEKQSCQNDMRGRVRVRRAVRAMKALVGIMVFLFGFFIWRLGLYWTVSSFDGLRRILCVFDVDVDGN